MWLDYFQQKQVVSINKSENEMVNKWTKLVQWAFGVLHLKFFTTQTNILLWPKDIKKISDKERSKMHEKIWFLEFFSHLRRLAMERQYEELLIWDMHI